MSILFTHILVSPGVNAGRSCHLLRYIVDCCISATVQQSKCSWTSVWRLVDMTLYICVRKDRSPGLTNADLLCSTCWAFIAELVITSFGQDVSALATKPALKEPTLDPSSNHTIDLGPETGTIIWQNSSVEHGGVAGMTLYALGPSDCLLLVLIIFVIVYLLPKKILRHMHSDAPPPSQRTRVPMRALGKQI